MNKLIILLLFTITLACNREHNMQDNELGLDILSIEANEQAQRKYSDQYLKELAHSKSHIALSPSDVKRALEKRHELKNFSMDTVNLFKVAVYRFYSQVDVKNKRLISRAKSADELGINEELFVVLQEGLKSLNKDLGGKSKLNDKMNDTLLKKSIDDQLNNFPN